MTAPAKPIRVGLIIVGDEILSGKREDKHQSKVIQLLGVRGLQLAWSHYIGDDREALTQLYHRTFASDDMSSVAVASAQRRMITPGKRRQPPWTDGVTSPGGSGSDFGTVRRNGAQGAWQRRHDHARISAAPENGRLSDRRWNYPEPV